MLPKAAKVYRAQTTTIRETLADPLAVHRARAAISELVGGHITQTPANSRDHLAAEVNLNQIVLLRAAGADNRLVVGASLRRNLARKFCCRRRLDSMFCPYPLLQLVRKLPQGVTGGTSASMSYQQPMNARAGALERFGEGKTQGLDRVQNHSHFEQCRGGPRFAGGIARRPIPQHSDHAVCPQTRTGIGQLH